MAGISNHYDTMVTLQGAVNALALTGLTGGAVIQEVATYQDGQTVLPFVSISPYGAERLDDELNNLDGPHYPILIAIIAKPNINLLEQRLAWRQTMRRNFNNVKLSQIISTFGLTPNANLYSEDYNLKVEPGNVIEPRAWFDRNGFVSGFVVRAYFQEQRS